MMKSGWKKFLSLHSLHKTVVMKLSFNSMLPQGFTKDPRRFHNLSTLIR